jgi:hypothetical protein
MRFLSLIMVLVMAIATEAYSGLLHASFTATNNGCPQCYIYATCGMWLDCINTSTSGDVCAPAPPSGCFNSFDYMYLIHTSIGSGSCNCSGTASGLTLTPRSGIRVESGDPYAQSLGTGSLVYQYDCYASYTVVCPNDPPSIPPCSQPQATVAAQCKGGKGLFMRTSGLNGANVLRGMFGSASNWDRINGKDYSYYADQPQVVITTDSPSGFDNGDGTSTRPDGSQCSLFNDGGGQLVDVLICPLGLGNEEDSSSSSEEDGSSDSSSSDSSSSDSNSSDSGNSAGSGENNSAGSGENNSAGSGGNNGGTCDGYEFECNSSGSGENNSAGSGENNSAGSGNNSAGSGGNSSGFGAGGDNSVTPGGVNPGVGSGSGGGEGTGGITCADLANCNWATIGNQLEQMGIDREQRDSLKSIVKILKDGNALTAEQIAAFLAMQEKLGDMQVDMVGGFSGVINAIGSGFSSLMGQITSLFGNGSGGNGNGNGEGNGGGEYPHICDNPSNQHLVECGGNGNGNGNGSGGNGGNGNGEGGDGDGGDNCSGVFGFFRSLFTSDCGGSPIPSYCDPLKEDCDYLLGIEPGDTVGGITKRQFDSSLTSLGLDKNSYARRVDTLMKDTAVLFSSMRSAVAPLTQCMTKDSGTDGVLDLSFDTGFMGIKCGNACRLDLKNFYGFNAAEVLNALIMFILVMSASIRIVRVAKTLGNAP